MDYLDLLAKLLSAASNAMSLGKSAATVFKGRADEITDKERDLLEAVAYDGVIELTRADAMPVVLAGGQLWRDNDPMVAAAYIGAVERLLDRGLLRFVRLTKDKNVLLQLTESGFQLARELNPHWNPLSPHED